MLKVKETYWNPNNKQNDHDQQHQEPEIWKSNFWGAYRSAFKRKIYNKQEVTIADVDFRQHEINSESQGKRIGNSEAWTRFTSSSKPGTGKFETGDL